LFKILGFLASDDYFIFEICATLYFSGARILFSDFKEGSGSFRVDFTFFIGYKSSKGIYLSVLFFD
jgi:hypothetical protein